MSNRKYSSFYKKRYLVNKTFQIRFILYSIAVALVAISLIYFTSMYFFWSFSEQGRSIGLEESHVFFVFLERQQNFMNELLLVLASFFIIGLTLSGLVLSNRVAGPLNRLNKHMRAVSKGEISSPVRFRKKDYFKELADSYNSQYQYLVGKIEASQVEYESDVETNWIKKSS